VTSTNDEAAGLAATGAEEGTLITARSQSGGRGRRGRVWQSPAGNLYLSLILRPADPLAGAAAIGFAASLAVADAVLEVSEGKSEAMLAFKWPNDVLMDGRKLSGLLIENTGNKGGDALILGIGINVSWHPTDLPYPATDLHAEGGGNIDVERLLQAFCTHFLYRYEQWHGSGFATLRAAWLERARGLGEALNVEVEGRRFDGIFAGIDEQGALCLDLGASGIKTITAGDVFFADIPKGTTC
jgi:BirA family biotin operon repressor/biotin-[acetyl-CoA-carboxylase] ligase